MDYQSLNEEEKLQIQQKQLAVIKKPAAERNEKEVQLLMHSTEHIQFFKNYNNDPSFKGIHRQCCKNMEYEFVKRGEWVFEIGKKFYLILGGSVSIWIYPPGDMEKNKEKLINVKTLGQGQGFGELALISKKPRLASIKTEEDCHFAILEKEHFKNILLEAENDKLLKEMGFFAELPLFQTWNFNLIKQLYLNSIKKTYKRGERVFGQGEKPDKIFIVSSGQYTVFKEIDIDCLEEEKYMLKPEDQQFNQLEGKNLKANRPPTKKLHQITNLAAHELFGEEDILKKQNARTFSVVCNDEGVLLEIGKNDLILRILTQRCSDKYLRERLEIKDSLMKSRLESLQNQLKITTFNQYEDQFYKMRIASPLKQSLRDKLFNNENLLKSTGVVHRKFNQEDLKKYNKKFDDELERRKQDEEKKPEFLNASTKLFLHKLQYQFKTKLGSEDRVKKLHNHIKSNSTLELIPSNLGTAPTMKELREEYEDELPKVVNQATLKYFLKKVNRSRQRSECMPDQVNKNSDPKRLITLNCIPEQSDFSKDISLKERKFKSVQTLFKSSLNLNDSNIKIEEEEDYVNEEQISARSPIIPSLNYLSIPLDTEPSQLVSSASKIQQSEPNLLFLTNNRNQTPQKVESLSRISLKNKQLDQKRLSIKPLGYNVAQSYVTPTKLTNQTSKHPNLTELLTEQKSIQQFHQLSSSQIRNTSNKFSECELINTDQYKQDLSNSPNKHASDNYRSVRFSSESKRFQTPQFNTQKISQLDMTQSQKLQSFFTQKGKNQQATKDVLFFTTSYVTPSSTSNLKSNTQQQQSEINSPFSVLPRKNDKMSKTMTDLQQVFLKEKQESLIQSFKKGNQNQQQQGSSSSILVESPVKLKGSQQNFMITNCNNKQIKPSTSSPNKKKRVIFI